MESRTFEPFPRQVLLGGVIGALTWDSAVFDVVDFRSVAWLFEVYATLPGTVTNPATLYWETSNEFDGPWVELNPGGENPNVGSPASGAIGDPGRYVRARVSVIQGEAAMVAVRCVARAE